ncbi:photosystem II reaction center protein Psb28 [Leptodesmis sichuanensis]|uniref:photosystem II reaction center protein Psb28 n=1 Tax=Leptodesmis sichuanensis TaxID=2906798 RepID=UPI001F1B37D4|nr:photosystem II reaction center protein Psb28 [Leptodesmis sichuanensis]UIE39669.1 photosystem II reaction center protein Psb28 [Leptodesmis sichuanensis A121]
MVTQSPSIQIFAGVQEELSGVSLRRNKLSGQRSAVLIFDKLESLEHFRSYWKRSANAVHLIDEEGEMLIEPSGVRFLYGGPEGEDLRRVECKLEIDQNDHWDRFMRFMNRYAAANDMVYGESGPSAPP